MQNTLRIRQETTQLRVTLRWRFESRLVHYSVFRYDYRGALLEHQQSSAYFLSDGYFRMESVDTIQTLHIDCSKAGETAAFLITVDGLEALGDEEQVVCEVYEAPGQSHDSVEPSVALSTEFTQFRVDKERDKNLFHVCVGVFYVQGFYGDASCEWVARCTATPIYCVTPEDVTDFCSDTIASAAPSLDAHLALMCLALASALPSLGKAFLPLTRSGADEHAFTALVFAALYPHASQPDAASARSQLAVQLIRELYLRVDVSRLGYVSWSGASSYIAQVVTCAAGSTHPSLQLNPSLLQQMLLSPAPEETNKVGFRKQSLDKLLSSTSQAVQRRVSPARRMRFWLPSAFDGKPYIALSDGRHLPYYNSAVSHRPSASIHRFPLLLWPTPFSTSDEAPRVDIYDSHEWSADTSEAARKLLLCARCEDRVQAVVCAQCCRGYCFPCALLVHATSSKKAHVVQLANPQVASTRRVDKSLLCHIDAANEIARDLRHIVSNMTNRSEVIRMRKERQLKADMDKQEALRLLAADRARAEDLTRHTAADRIAALLYFRSSKSLVREKSIQVRLARLVAQQSQILSKVVLIQKTFRLYSIKCWAAGLKSNGKRDKDKKVKKMFVLSRSVQSFDLEARLSYDMSQRRCVERAGILSDMRDGYVQACQMHVRNIEYWMGRERLIPGKALAVEARRRALDELHKDVLSAEAASISEASVSTEGSITKKHSPVAPSRKRSLPAADPLLAAQAVASIVGSRMRKLPSFMRGAVSPEVVCKGLRVAILNLDHQIENLNLETAYIAQCVRSGCRRLSYLKERYSDKQNRLAWIAQEFFAVERAALQMNRRMAALDQSRDCAMPLDWLSKHLALANGVLTSLDAQQESIALDEIESIKASEKMCVETDLLLANLLDSLQLESRYSAERVFLDRGLLFVVKGSDEALLYADQAYAVKRKQDKLVNGVIDALVVALQEKLSAEYEGYSSIVAFPSDDPQLRVSEMPSTINATLLNKFKGVTHFDTMLALQIYYIQPWLSAQAVEDVRTEDDVVVKELGLDAMQTELRTLRERIREEEEGYKTVGTQISDIEEELEAMLVEPKKTNKNDEDIAKYVREETLSVLKAELKAKSSEREQLLVKIEKMKGLIEPATERNLAAQTEISVMKEQLLKRAAERKRLEEVFFAVEEKVVLGAIRSVEGSLELFKSSSKDLHERAAVCDLWSTSVQLRGKYEGGTLSLHEMIALDIPVKVYYETERSIGACRSSASPRLFASPLEHRTALVDMLKASLNLDQRHFAFAIEQLSKELAKAVAFKTQRVFNEQLRVAFQEELIAQRRQKSLQKELALRKQRIEDMRIVRLKQMRADREALLAKKEKAQQKKDKRYVDELKNSKLVRQTNRLREKLGDVKDSALAAVLGKEAPMDSEQARMMDAIGAAGKDNMEDKAQGIRNIKITVGDAETEYFQRRMQMLIDKRLPYYTRVTKSIGRQISVWCQFTYNTQQFITSMDVGHISSEHPYFKDLTAFGYESVGHPALKLVFWYSINLYPLLAIQLIDVVCRIKRDQLKLSAISQLDFGFSTAEEEKLIQNSYEIVCQSLFEFDLPDCSLWACRINKVLTKATKANVAVATNTAIQQLHRARQMLQEHPDNLNLQAMEARFIEDVEECYRKEEAAEVGDPVEKARRLLALDDYELDLWLDVFEKMDKTKIGKVRVEEVFELVDEILTASGRQVFASMNALDSDGFMEFGDFILSVGTFCFFGHTDVLKFLYTWADRDHKGIITQADYINLLNDLHPYDKTRAIRALKVQKNRVDNQIPFEEFVQTNSKFPGLLFPQFKLQNSLRHKILGEDWWLRKLNKYKETRDKIVNDAELLDRKAEMELKAFDENEERKRRMELRSRAILQETSAVKLAILNARQFTDALK